MNFNNKVIKKVLAEICNNYVEVIITGLEEETQRLPHTLALIQFMTTLDYYNIDYSLNKTLTDIFLDKVDSEITKYLAR